jgi:type I restriction enzyme, R subunit
MIAICSLGQTIVDRVVVARILNEYVGRRLEPRTQAPFLGILADRTVARGESGDKNRLGELASLTVKMVEMVRLRTCTVDFWRNTHRQNLLRGEVVEFLDDNDVVPFGEQEAVADEVVELAKALHARLCP